MKTLILVRDKNSYFWKNLKNTSSFDVKKTYLKKFVGEFWENKRKGYQNNYNYFGILNSWILNLKKYDKIIVLDSAYSKQIDYYLNKTNAKVYFFYWNGLHKNEEIANIHINSICNSVNIYSYSRYDCDKYGLAFNSTMYYPVQLVKEKKQWDLIFVGYVFGKRLSQIDEILDLMNEYGFTYKIYAVRDQKRTAKEYQTRNYRLVNDGVEYNQYIKQVMMSSVILDIDKFDEVGCSLRAMESIFYEKKLITTNKRVIEELFYDSENVFIWGVDNKERLKEFMCRPYKKLANEIVNYYRIDEWINRFE